jgi:ABC-type polar amino acid transport system ATPase subunit
VTAPFTPPRQDAGASPVLTASGICKTFQRGTRSEVHVLRDVTFSVFESEVLVIIGPSGSGKSTLLRTLTFLEPPDTGSVTFLGKTWTTQEFVTRNPIERHRKHQELRQLRAHMGMVFQHFNLFPHMTALRNVAIGPIRARGFSKKQAEETALKELARVDLGDKAHAFPSQLSGGQKQRVAIARALAMEPRLMLFDEPTSALDPELVGGVLDEMRKLALAGMTMIVVTHEMGFARDVGDRVLFMDHGRIIEEGRAREVLADPQTERMRQFLATIR